MSMEYQQLMEDTSPLKTQPIPVRKYNLSWKNREGKEYLKVYEYRIKDFINKRLLPTEYFAAPLGVQLELTNACNLRCIQCYNNSGQKLPNELTISEWVKVVEELCGMQIFECVISGGEPLLLGDDLFTIMDVLLEHDVVILFITNGWFLDRKVFNRLKKYKYAQIQVSIDGATPSIHDEIRGVKGSWERAVYAGKLVADSGIPLVIAHTLMDKNLHELPQMIDLSAEIGAKEFITEEAVFTGRAALIHKNLKLHKKQREEFYKIIEAKSTEYVNCMSIKLAADVALVLRTCRLEPNRGYIIRPTGDIRLDCTAPFKLGNIRENSFEEIWRVARRAWQHPKVNEFIEHLQSNDDLMKFKDIIPFITKDISIEEVK
ncbi:MAG: radical SAM protein [bacterium]